MRISTAFMYQQNLQGFMQVMGNQYDINSRISAGQMLLKPSDDPSAAAQSIRYSGALTSNAQYALAREYANDALGQQDNVLQNVANDLDSVKSKLVAANNDTLSDADRQNYAKDLENLRDQMFDLGNTRDSDGNYIFAGYNTDKPAFVKDKDGNISYQGGDTPISQDVSDTSDMTVSHTGNQVFSHNGNDIFATLNKAIAALKKPVTDDTDRANLKKVLDDANTAVSNIIDNVGTVRAQVGNNMQQIEALDKQGNDQKVSLTDQYEKAVGGDGESIIEMVTRSKMSSFALAASKMVLQSMQSMSLFNLQ